MVGHKNRQNAPISDQTSNSSQRFSILLTKIQTYQPVCSPHKINMPPFHSETTGIEQSILVVGALHLSGNKETATWKKLKVFNTAGASKKSTSSTLKAKKETVLLKFTLEKLQSGTTNERLATTLPVVVGL